MALDKTIMINVAGTCVLRDIFSMQSLENREKYKVVKFISQFEPLAVCDEKIYVDEKRYWEFDASPYISNFLKRCKYLDMTRTAIDYLAETKADYLLVDAGLLRRGFYQMAGGG